MDFKCCLLASLLTITLISYAEIPSHMTDDVIGAIYSNREWRPVASKIKTLITQLSLNILARPFG